MKSSGGGSSSGGGGGRGGSSGGNYISSNVTNITVTDKNGKNVSVSKSTDKDGNMTLTLPNGADLTGDNYYTIKVTDGKGNAKADVSIVLKDKKNNSANGTTDKNGMLILPGSKHKAYIMGYPDGSFRPDGDMSRAEAAAIFARLIADKKKMSL
ncbi:MAG: S-layer homology domain-containing protein [Clostridiales bacterium]|nr:MAG: S-layer homology domain-containing protein [Clostridiales bacterium]